MPPRKDIVGENVNSSSIIHCNFLVVDNKHTILAEVMLVIFEMSFTDDFYRNSDTFNTRSIKLGKVASPLFSLRI